MKRILLLSAVLLCKVVCAVAQQSQANRLLVHMKNGSTVVYAADSIEHIDFALVADLEAGVQPASVDASSMSVNVTLPQGCSLAVVAVIPAPDAQAGVTAAMVQQHKVAELTESGVVDVAGLDAGTAYVVAVLTHDQYGLPCSITTSTLATLAARDYPLPGDYFYSDGTWSQGGLLSINADGTNPVWSEVLPAPVAGKEVVGLVFSVDTGRIAQADKEAGFTHGYVMATRNVYPAGKNTVQWCMADEFEVYQVTKLASSFYKNLKGRQESQIALEYFDNPEWMVPAFYYAANNLTPNIPGTSGWFLPSTGQLWDALANLLGHEVATAMKPWRDYAYDATYYASDKTIKVNPLEKFNEAFAKVPASMREDLEIDDEYHEYATLWTSSRYDSEAADTFIIGMENGKNLIECMCNWYNGDCYARPILAF